jgi:hypothetical protein
MPNGVDKLKRTPIELPDDKKTTAFNSITKHTYTPEQLAIICYNTNDFGRAMIGVCVNCAFGASEVGQWKTSNYTLYKAHPYAERIGIVSTDADSWIVGNRIKKAVYGEHLLWSEVADAVAPFLDGREVLPVTREGKPWYKLHSSNAQQAFCNWWMRLLDKVVAQVPEFPRLPFGSLRDTLPDILRREYSAELASICLQHGRTSDDDLLRCYANVPFGKLFTATRELTELFRPFLDAVVHGGDAEEKRLTISQLDRSPDRLVLRLEKRHSAG